jgi:hypothetical protein
MACPSCASAFAASEANARARTGLPRPARNMDCDFSPGPVRYGSMRWLAPWAALLVLCCATYREHLTRGQRLYQENKYEDALAIWRVLEADMDSLDPGDQARYAYLRGMTDFRLGFRDDARHWLAISKAINAAHPGGLSGDWPERVDAALTDLNREVYGLAQPAAGDSAAAASGSSTSAPVEGFDTPTCQSDANCKLPESCIAGHCRAATE